MMCETISSKVFKILILSVILFTLINTTYATEINATIDENIQIDNDVEIKINEELNIDNDDSDYFMDDSQDIDKIRINRPFFNKTITNINFTTFEDFLNSNNLKLSSQDGCYFVSQDFVLNHKGLPFVVRLMDNYGNPLEGGTVIFNINGVNYNRIVDSDGYARLNINLNNGVYTITFTFQGNSYYSSTSGTRTISMISGKLNPNLSSNGLVKYYGDTTPLKIYLKDNNHQAMTNKDVTISINGATYTRTSDSNGIVSLNINLLAGSFQATIHYPGDTYYNPITITTQVTVNKKTSSLIANNLTKYYNTSDQFIARLVSDGNPLINKNIKLTINGVTYDKITDNNGYVYLNINPEVGTYNINVVYDGDDYYKSTSISKTVTIKEHLATTLTGENLIKYYGDSNNFKVKLTSGNTVLTGKTISFKVNGVTYNSVTNSEGYAFLSADFKTGTYTITCLFDGDLDYLSSTITRTLTINKKTTNIIANNLVIPPQSSIMYNISLKSNNNSLKDKTVKFTVNGVTYTKTTNNNGLATLNNINLNPGTYTITIVFEGDDYYSNSSVSKTIIIREQSNTILIINELTKFYGSNESLNIILKDEFNNLLSNQNIIFKINNKNYTRTTNNQGIASININLLPGTYSIGVYYEETTNHKNTNATTNIIIKTTIQSNNIVKMYLNDTQFNVLFLNTQGAPLANTEVSFNINGVIYKRTTNNNGVAKLNINLDPGKYIITSINPLTGETKRNNITVGSPIIENNDLIKYHGNSSRFVVRIIGSDGNPVNAGENVTFNINGVLYTRQTDNQSYCSIAIHLRPGDYIITTMYNDYSIENNIHVLSRIITSDLTSNKTENCIFPTRLVDNQGNSLSNETLTYNINGVFYHKTTDNQGMTYLNLNLNVGEYIVTIQYGGLEISNRITITNQSTIFSNNIYFNRLHIVSIKNIINSAIHLKNHVNNYLILPDKINVSGKQLTIFEFSYLMANTINNINNGINETNLQVPHLSKNIVYEDHYSNLELSQYTYTSMFNSIVLFANINGYMPNNMTLMDTVIDFKTYTYVCAKILSFYNLTNTFPSQCNFTSAVLNYSYINRNDLSEITQFGKGLNEYNYDTNLELYLVNGTDCEITQRIENLAYNLVNHITSTLDKARALYTYVQNIPYDGYYPIKRGVNYVLDNNKGNYVDKTNLFVALCRACNIPVKYNSGTTQFSSANFNHIWSQVLIGDWWYVADTSSYRNSIGFVNNWKTNTITEFSQGNLYSNLTSTSLTYNGPIKQYPIQYINFTFNYLNSGSADIMNPNFTSNSHVELEFTNINQNYGYSTISLKLTDNQGFGLFNKTVFLSVLGKLYTGKTDLWGYVDFDVKLILGTYKITATFKNEGKYSAIEKNQMLNVNKTQPIIITSNVISEGNPFKLYLKDHYENPLPNQIILLKINNKQYNLKTNNAGFVSINLNLTNGKYNVVCIFNGNKYYNSVISNTELFIKNKTKITGNDLIINSGENFTITLSSNNKVLSNKLVQFKILDSHFNLIKTFEKTTNNKGIISTIINLNPGLYKIFYQFKDDNGYLDSYDSSTIYVVSNNISTDIEVLDTVVHEKGEYLTCILRDSIRNPIANATCHIQVNGVTYTKTTDNNGVFKLKINLDKGKYNVFCNFNNNNKYDSCLKYLLLNVSYSPNIIYTVNMSLKTSIRHNNKDYLVPYGREIGIYKNNQIYKFGYDYTATEVTKLDYNKLYFISLTNTNSIQIINSDSEVNCSGFSLFSDGRYVLIKYYGYKKNNITRFDAIYDGKKYFSKQIENVTLMQNEISVATFYFTSELTTQTTKTFLTNLGFNSNYKFYNSITTDLTIINPGYWSKINSISVKTLRYGDTNYDNKLKNMDWNSNLGYETVESFLNIENIKVTDDVLAQNLNQDNFNTQAEYATYNAYLTNLAYRWLSDKLADEISETYCVTWFRSGGSTGMTRTNIGLDGVNFDDKDTLDFKGDNFASYKANNDYYLKGSVLEEYVMYLHGGNSSCGVKEVINGLINDKNMYCNISSSNLTLGLSDDSATLIFNLIGGSVGSLIRPDILVNQTQNGGVYLGDFSFLNIGAFCDNLINVYNVIKSPDDMAGYICDQLGWDERAKTMLSFTLDIVVSAAVIGFTIAFPEFAMAAIALKVGSSLWSNGIFKNPMDRNAWLGVGADVIVGRAGSNAVNYFVRHSKDTKLNHAIAEGLWYVNIENPVNMLKTASNKVMDDIWGEE